MPQPPTLPLVSGQPLGVLLLAPPLADNDLCRAWLDWLDARPNEYELLIVYDGPPSTSLTLTHPRLRILCLDKPQGVGRALQAGLAALSQPLLAYAPLTAEYRPEHLGLLLDRVIPELQIREIDLVHLLCGYRAGTKMPMLPRVTGWLWRMFCHIAFNYPPTRLAGWLGVRRHVGWIVLRMVFALRYHDPLCPLRLFRRELLDRLPIQSVGPFAHVEMLAKSNFLGRVFGSEQVPLDVRPPAYSDDISQMWRDMQAVMNNPDFGPVETIPGMISPSS